MDLKIEKKVLLNYKGDMTFKHFWRYDAALQKIDEFVVIRQYIEDSNAMKYLRWNEFQYKDM